MWLIKLENTGLYTQEAFIGNHGEYQTIYPIWLDNRQLKTNSHSRLLNIINNDYYLTHYFFNGLFDFFLRCVFSFCIFDYFDRYIKIILNCNKPVQCINVTIFEFVTLIQRINWKKLKKYIVKFCTFRYQYVFSSIDRLGKTLPIETITYKQEIGIFLRVLNMNDNFLRLIFVSVTLSIGKDVKLDEWSLKK